MRFFDCGSMAIKRRGVSTRRRSNLNLRRPSTYHRKDEGLPRGASAGRSVLRIRTHFKLKNPNIIRDEVKTFHLAVSLNVCPLSGSESFAPITTCTTLHLSIAIFLRASRRRCDRQLTTTTFPQHINHYYCLLLHTTSFLQPVFQQERR